MFIQNRPVFCINIKLFPKQNECFIPHNSEQFRKHRCDGLFTPIGSKEKIQGTYFEICQTYFKICQTCFLTFENPFAKRLKDADKIQTTRRPVPGQCPYGHKTRREKSLKRLQRCNHFNDFCAMSRKCRIELGGNENRRRP